MGGGSIFYDFFPEGQIEGMTSIRGMTDGFPGGIRRSYISTDTFNAVFYTYNNDTLTPLPDSLAGYCPSGRILRENGKKLFPEANPGVNQYYVGVYDAITFFNGYIDPNDAHFAVYNTDKPVYIGDSTDYGSNNLPDLGPSVYTNGNIIAVSAPDLSNYVGIIEGTVESYDIYAQAYFNDVGLPAMEVYNGQSYSGANMYLNNISSAVVSAYGDNPFIISEGQNANITVVGDSKATIDVISPNPTINVYGSNTSNNPVILTSTIAAYTSLNYHSGISSPQFYMANSKYYAEMSFSGAIYPYVESGNFVNNNYAGIDGHNGDLYATGMLSLANSVGNITLSAGTYTTSSNTIFTYNPYIFLSYKTTSNGTPGSLYYSINTGAGTLTVNSTSGSDSNVVNWLAVYNNF